MAEARTRGRSGTARARAKAETAGSRKRTGTTGRTPAGGRRPEAPRTGDERPLCTVAFCPICMAVTASRSAAPEAVEHMLNAAREFLLAARAVVEARAEDLASHDGRPRDLQRIDIA